MMFYLEAEQQVHTTPWPRPCDLADIKNPSLRCGTVLLLAELTSFVTWACGVLWTRAYYVYFIANKLGILHAREEPQDTSNPTETGRRKTGADGDEKPRSSRNGSAVTLAPAPQSTRRGNSRARNSAWALSGGGGPARAKTRHRRLARGTRSALAKFHTAPRRGCSTRSKPASRRFAED